MPPHLPVSAYPPMLSSTSWPTAPVIGMPRFVSFPGGAVFVPQYTWGDASTAEKKKKEAAKKRAKKLRERAQKVEKKAGIKTTPKPAKAKITQLKSPGAHLSRSGSSAPSTPALEQEPVSAEPGQTSTPPEEVGITVPVGAEEGASNMKYIVGGSIFLLLGLGAAYLWQQQKKEKPEDPVAPIDSVSSSLSSSEVPEE